MEMSSKCLRCIAAASVIVVVNSYLGFTQPLSQPRALDLDINNRGDALQNVIQLKTGVYRFTTKTGTSSAAVVDLFSMVHIADSSYFENIKDRMKEYDVVLYELITDNKNCDNSKGSSFKRQLNTEISATETEKLASQYQLESQVSLYNSIGKNRGPTRANNWFIADLDSNEVMRLEVPRKHLTIASFRANRSAGRAREERFLRKFFLSDIALITALRYLSWLGPCPEFSCLLLDWSRWNQPTKAGGLPPALLPIIENVSMGNIFAARKLAFAQQLISGVPDSGSWGGEALSDTEVRVKARNTECCRVLKGFLEEHEEAAKIIALPEQSSTVENIPKTASKMSTSSTEVKSSELKIAILYGAYHIEDLSAKLRAMGMKAESASSLTAWSMEYPSIASPSDHTVNANVQKEQEKEKEKDVAHAPTAAKKNFFGSRTIAKAFKSIKGSGLSVSVAGICTMYLVVCALDWWLMIDFLVEVVQGLRNSVSSGAANSIVTDLVRHIIAGEVGEPLSEDAKIVEISLSVLYSLAYVQRHLWALRAASSVGVQWDRGLFDDSLNV